MSPRSSRGLALVAVVSALAPSLVVARSWAQPIDPYARPAAPPPPPSAPVAPAPVDPYGAPPPPTLTSPPPPAADDVDAEVAAALLDRARALSAAGDLAGARQLASEAAARGGDRPVGAEARALVVELDRQLAPSESPPPPPVEFTPPPPPPIEDFDPPIVAPAPARTRGPLILGAYGALGGAAVGVALAGTDNDQTLITALGGAAVGGLGGYYVARSRAWTPARAHLVGSGLIWGAVAGGAFADVVTGVEGTTADDVAAGTALGALGGALVGSLAARDPELTTADAALVDSLSLWGLIAGLTTGVAIDPPEGEAYSLNATLGIAAGQLVGHLAARRTEISGRRLLRVNGLALLGAGVPLLLWQASEGDQDSTSVGSGKPWGLLATAGLVGGVYLGFRWTRGLDGDAAGSDAPAALFRRGTDGAWVAGGLALAPVRQGRGASLTLVSGRW